MKTVKFCILAVVLIMACNKKENVKPSQTQTEDTLTSFNKKIILGSWSLSTNNVLLITFTDSLTANYSINSPYFENTGYHNTYDIRHDSLYFNGKFSYSIVIIKDTLKLRYSNGENAGYTIRY